MLPLLVLVAVNVPACEHCDETCRAELRPVHCRGIDARGIPAVLPPPSCSRAVLQVMGRAL